MRRYGAAFFLLLQSLALSAQQNPFTERLLKNRSSISFLNGHLAGNGSQVLYGLLDGAQFVMVGEDHATAEIPQFVGELCDVLGPNGFHTFAVEAGQLVAAPLQRWASEDDHRARVDEFLKKFPDSIAFFNLAEEDELISHCASAFSQNGQFALWGLDQEFMGASGYILQRTLDTKPGKNSETALREALREEARLRSKAVASGNPADLYMLAARDEDVDHIRDLLRVDGSAEGQSLWEQFKETREIYRENMTGLGFESNRRRALWMKTTFLRDFEQSSTSSTGPKVLFKLGDWHLYKGMNPLHNNDLGNFVAEMADGRRQKAVNIIILGVQGSHLHFAGIGKPYQSENSKMLDDPDYKFMRPFVENLATDGWTVFDLREMRKNFRSLGNLDTSMERLIFGYDVLILVPQVTAATQIQ